MKNKNVFKINLIYFIAIFLVAGIFLLGYSGILKNDFLTSFLIQIVVMFAIPLLLYSFFTKKSVKETFVDAGLKKISGKMVGISILLGFVLYFINAFVADGFSGLLSLFGYESLPSSSTTTFNYGTLLKEFVLSCILPGFCEEFLHRGILLHAKKKFANTKTCLLISSILFGLTHLNIRQFFYAATLGFLMGYVSLLADSIIPSIIIHFMNNFLSNYFFYGTYLDWPLARFFNYVTNIFMSDIFIFIITLSIGIIILLMLYHYLTRWLFKERIQNEIITIVSALKTDNLTLIQAQIRINQVNQILKERHANEKAKQKPSFIDNIFLISSFVLATIVTISSFIWGVI